MEKEIDLNQEFEIYDSIVHPASQKQVNLIKKLMTIEKVKSELKLESESESESIESLNLTAENVKSLMKKYKEKSKLTSFQLSNVEKNLTITEIQQALKNINIKTYEDLKYNHYQILSWKFPILEKKFNKFNLVVHDTPLKWTNDYEYGYQESKYCHQNKMYYIKFYKLVMIDYDDITLKEVIAKLEKINKKCNFLFYIFKTFNGYHVFIMSHAIPHYENDAVNLMKELGSDMWYVMFSKKNGFKIRLNKKMGRNEKCVSKFIMIVGGRGRAKLNSYCKKMLQIYQKYQKIHDN